MANKSESLLLARIEKTMPGRPSCAGMPPSAWVEELRQVVSQVSDENEPTILSEFFKGLGDPVRVKIVTLLVRKGELCVCEIQAAIGLMQSLTSHHLNILRRAGIVKASKKGTWVHYGLQKGVADLLDRSKQLLK